MINTTENTPLMYANALADTVLSTPYNSTPSVEVAAVQYTQAHQGDTFTFYRYSHLPPAATVLRDDIPSPQPERLHREFIPVKMNFYGRSVMLSSHFVYYDQFDNEQMAAELLGIAMVRGQEEIVRDKLFSTTNIFSCSSGSNSDDPTHFSYNDILDVENWHYSNNSIQFTKTIEASPNEGTMPINASFILIMPTLLSSTLKQIPQFTTPERYGSYHARFSLNEFGSISSHRCLMSTGYNDPVRSSATGSAVHRAISLGQGAITQLLPADPSAATLERVDTSANDPHRKSILMALTYLYAVGITNEMSVCKVECTVN